MGSKVAVIVGIGPGNGSALARRFAAAGYATALLSRRLETSSALAGELGNSRAYACDATDASAVGEVFQQIRADLGAVDTLVHNAGNAVWGDIESLSPRDFEDSWRVNTLGLVHTAQAVIPDMTATGGGNIAVIGATASKRGGAGFAAFASSKAAQYVLAQSMARHLSPRGVHVSYYVIDGAIDLPRSRQRMPDAPDDFFLQPADIAETVFNITQQPRSAWSFEVDLRPFGEKW
ncbi:MAG: SDR family NAD(P)-dependent oxidoreductase [Pseudomonadota bacterium]|nr:SDR family NAD(P)-dependent oxidoreductase [Pseudomonadota bacterium]